MKYAAIVMIVLAAAALALGIYTYANARLVVTSISMESLPAFERQEDFAALQTAVDQGALMGTPYADEVPGSSLDYNFLTFTFRLKNNGLIGAEMVEIQPLPVNGDVLSYTTLDPERVNESLNVGSRQERDTWCVVLASAQSDAQTSRSFRITYYLWGSPRTMTVNYN